MKNKSVLVSAILCSSSLLAQQKPNIVLIVADDMRGSTLEFMGKEQIKTPTLNQLAQVSVFFNNAHIMGGTSAAVSMPSRAMLMTGKYLYNLESKGATIPNEHTIIGEMLRGAGYNTFHTGKWHNGKDSFNRSFSQDNDIFFGGMYDHWNVPLFSYDTSGEYKDKRKVIKNAWANNEVEILEGEYVKSGIHSVDIFTDTAIEFINDQANEQTPFFLSLCYMSPHDPRSMPEEYMQLYNSKDIELPSNYMKQHPFDNGEMRIRDEVLAAIPRIDNEVKTHIAEYYAMISHLDDRINDVISSLKENGIYDNTIIIFIADNGLAVGQHGLMGKQNLYENSVNVPMIIKMNAQNQEQKINDHLCYLIDIFPTVCDWIDKHVPQSVDGKSLTPIIENNTPIRDYLCFAYTDLQRSVSDGEWKLIEYNVNGEKHTQLFNLKNDPMEINNLIHDNSLNDKVDTLRLKMTQLKEETNDNSKFWEQ